jgi:hypothetical protein
MVVQAENTRLAVLPAIGFETLEAGARIMKHVRCRVHRQRRKRLDRRLAPAAVLKPRDRQVIAENGAKLGH